MIGILALAAAFGSVYCTILVAYFSFVVISNLLIGGFYCLAGILYGIATALGWTIRAGRFLIRHRPDLRW